MNKQELREIYLSRRQQLKEEEVDSLSRQLCRKLLQEVQLKEVKYLHLFLPIARHKEVNTWYIIQAIREQHPHIGLVVSKTDWKNRQMLNYHLLPDTELQENKLGIPEPVNALSCPAQQIDLVLLPLLAFDLRGQRVGYGAGFYDRFLADCLPGTLRIGLSLFAPEEEPISDTNEHDIPMDGCITPDQIYWFNKGDKPFHS